MCDVRPDSNGNDDRGNVAHNSHRAFGFNRANQLVSSGANAYRYDGHNRRVKQVDGSGISYSMYTRKGRLLYRETGVNSATGAGDGVNYIFLGRKLIAKEGVFSDTGSSVQHYKPFGETIEVPKDEIGYTGHKFDADLELSYMQARYYDPAIGRFYSNDPIGTVEHLSQGNIQGFNRYVYGNNNPYKYVDPDGKVGVLAFFLPFLGGTGGAAATTTAAAATTTAVTFTATELAIGVVAGTAIAGTAVVVMNESSDSSSTENKGQGQAEVGDCPTCGGETSNKPGKIGKAHGLKSKEVRDRIHGVKNGQLTGNPDVEVCNECGEVFPQTEDGSLGDSIGNIEDDY